MSNLVNDVLHLNGKMRHLMALSLIMVFACLTGSCGDDDDKLVDEPETPVNPGGDEGDEPELPDTKGTALFFDVDGTTNFPAGVEAKKNITVSKIEGEKNGYQLTFAEGDEHFIVTKPLEADLVKRNVKLTFLYQCDTEISRLGLQYLTPTASEEVYKGVLASSKNVDVDENGYAVAGFVLTRDMETYNWGIKDNMIRLNIKVAANTILKIKDIYLEETNEDPDPVEDPDFNKYPLTFTPNRGAHWNMENTYGIYSGISFTKSGDEYTLLIDDSYNASGIALEHYIATDPLTRSLIVEEEQVVELIFKYKANVDFVLNTGLYPFDNPSEDWPASFTESKVTASANNKPDKDGWATFTHNLSRSITTKVPRWGLNVDENDQQIRFMIRDVGADFAHPEKNGLDKLELKDVHLYVREKREDEKPVGGEVKLFLEAAGYQIEKGLTTFDENNGEYDITFTGNFAGLNGGEYTEYEVFTKALESELLAGVTYNLEFEYQIPIALDAFRVLYWQENGGGDNLPEENSKGTEACSDSKWKKYSSPLTNRANHSNWGGKGQKLRIHFYSISMQDPNGEEFGKPLNVKVKNVKLVPAQ
ncbi:hypothetical protein [Bacteroides acidifaciens]|uniref:hypothetical protein n=1 Tax=Bacteroides acidifaciens TaxID=85831 RepID=UPI001588F71A|nr:hypothetical protein [Bacteroides acidifaciens]